MKYRATEIYSDIHYQRCRSEKEDESSSHGNRCNRCCHDEELSYKEDCLWLEVCYGGVAKQIPKPLMELASTTLHHKGCAPKVFQTA